MTILLQLMSVMDGGGEVGINYTLTQGTGGAGSVTYAGFDTNTLSQGNFGSINPTAYVDATLKTIALGITNAGGELFFTLHVRMSGNRAQSYFSDIIFDNTVTLATDNVSTYGYNSGSGYTSWTWAGDSLTSIFDGSGNIAVKIE